MTKLPAGMSTKAGTEGAKGMGTQKAREAHANMTMQPSDRERLSMLLFILPAVNMHIEFASKAARNSQVCLIHCR
jgi:hypothetical protein